MKYNFRNSPLVWEDKSRILDLFRTFAIFFIVANHIPYVFTLSFNSVIDSDFTELVILFCKEGLGRVSSPGLGFISAILLMKGMSEFANIDCFNIIKKKFSTLFFPYFFWNIVLFVFFVFIFILFNRDEMGVLNKGYFLSFYDGVVNPLRWPVNGPLHYLKDIFITSTFFVLLYPLFKLNRFILIIFTIFSPFLLVLFGSSGSWFGDNMYSLLPRVDLFFYFALGLCLYNYMDFLFSQKMVSVLAKPISFLMLSIVTLIFSLLMYYFTHELTFDFNFYNVFMLYVFLLCRGLVFFYALSIAFIIYKYTNLNFDRKFAFRLFCSHSVFIYIINGVVNNFISDKFVLYIVTLISVVFLVYVIHVAINKISYFFSFKIKYV
jgi:hypothetical protein